MDIVNSNMNGANMSNTDNISRHANPAENAFEKTIFWKAKVWLQFTGWLLYLANSIMILLLLLIAAIGSWVGVLPVILVWLPLALAALLALNLCYDLLTVRYNIRPKEAVPAPLDKLNVFELMRARVSCRSFQNRNITEQHLKQLMKATDKYSAADSQLGSSRIRFEYIAAPLTVWPVVGCREFLVAIAPKEYNRLAVIDVGRSLQKVVLDMSRLGLSTCWIGPGADQKSIIHHLGEKFNLEKDHVICICAIGYASKFKPLALRGMQRAQRNRLPLEQLFFAGETFQSPLKTMDAPYDKFAKCYKACQWSPSSYNGQTTRCAAVLEEIDGQTKSFRFDFCASTHSKYYAVVALGIWCANWELGCKELGYNGHFKVLSEANKRAKGIPDLPKYDVSWVLEDKLK